MSSGFVRSKNSYVGGVCPVVRSAPRRGAARPQTGPDDRGLEGKEKEIKINFKINFSTFEDRSNWRRRRLRLRLRHLASSDRDRGGRGCDIELPAPVGFTGTHQQRGSTVSAENTAADTLAATAPPTIRPASSTTTSNASPGCPNGTHWPRHSTPSPTPHMNISTAPRTPSPRRSDTWPAVSRSWTAAATACVSAHRHTPRPAPRPTPFGSRATCCAGGTGARLVMNGRAAMH
jgi:hypothetical protein